MSSSREINISVNVKLPWSQVADRLSTREKLSMIMYLVRSSGSLELSILALRSCKSYLEYITCRDSEAFELMALTDDQLRLRIETGEGDLG